MRATTRASEMRKLSSHDIVANNHPFGWKLANIKHNEKKRSLQYAPEMLCMQGVINSVSLSCSDGSILCSWQKEIVSPFRREKKEFHVVKTELRMS